jgi:hypothetical protein
MAKLYPPSIEGKLPAFAGNTLKIPITMNRAVSINQVSSMRAMIKTVQTSQLKATLVGSLNYEATTGRYYAIFTLGGSFQPNLGQYYKVQVAYVDKNSEIGYYSSVGTIKYTSYPNLTIPGLETNFYGKYDYVGEYSQEDVEVKEVNPETGVTTLLETIKKDNTEKAYSYRFDLTDRDGNLIATSGVQMHDASTDKSTTSSQDHWALRREMTKDVPYYLQYKVTTTNGLEVSSARYLVMDQDSVDIDMKLVLMTEMDYDNGCTVLSFYPESEKEEEHIIISGSFVLIRASSADNFGTWDEVYRFTYSNVSLTVGNPVKLWEDCTVQQGVEYLYALQAYNSYGLYSNRIISINKNDNSKNTIYADFEDAYLYDGERQLRIRYNPKVTSFKETVLESKMDTIGSQFPFVFRNGNVRYKEFPISGLISLQSDPEERFLKGIQSENLISIRDFTPSSQTPSSVLDHHLSSSNIQREREFKIAVLEWLNNGKPKLFRSATEGNYIVRLMNISMSPNDTLGRMLHTFSCTAYEIAEHNFANLIKLGLIELPPSNTTSLRVGQISPKTLTLLSENDLKALYPDFSLHNNTINMPASYGVNITEATPGTRVGLNFANGLSEVVIEIGDTGTYYVQINEHPLTSIRLAKGKWDDAKITFNYYDDTPSDTFSSIADLALTDEIRQVIGLDFNTNIVEGLEDIRRDIGQFHYIRVTKKQVEKIWQIGNEFYRNATGVDIVNKWDSTLLYEVVGKNVIFNGHPDKPMRPEDIDYRFALNPSEPKDYIDFGGRDNKCGCANCGWIGDANDLKLDAEDYRTLCPSCSAPVDARFGDTFGRIDAIRNVDKVTALHIGNGIIVDIAYRVRTKTYVVEETDDEVRSAKSIWQQRIEELDNWVAHPSMTNTNYNTAVKNVNDSYALFISKLDTALKRKKGGN